MSHPLTARLALTAIWLSGPALPLPCQTSVSAVGLAPKATLAVKPRAALAPVQQLPSLNSVYPALRTEIAKALGMTLEQVPLVPVLALGLNKVGNVVSIKPFGPNEAGFSIRAQHVNIERYSTDKKQRLLVDSRQGTSERAEISFDCDQAPVGSYLFFVNFGNQDWSYAVSDYDHCTPLLQLPASRMVAFNKTATGWMGIGLSIPLNKNWNQPIESVDVMRVK